MTLAETIIVVGLGLLLFDVALVGTLGWFAHRRDRHNVRARASSRPAQGLDAEASTRNAGGLRIGSVTLDPESRPKGGRRSLREVPPSGDPTHTARRPPLRLIRGGRR